MKRRVIKITMKIQKESLNSNTTRVKEFKEDNYRTGAKQRLTIGEDKILTITKAWFAGNRI